MKRRFKTVVAVTTLAITASTSLNTQACDRGGRRITITRSHFGLPVSPFNRYAPPTYSQPSFPQPVYSSPQMTYQQPAQMLPPSQNPSMSPPSNFAPQNPGNPSLVSGRPVMNAPAQRMNPQPSAAMQPAQSITPRMNAQSGSAIQQAQGIGTRTNPQATSTVQQAQLTSPRTSGNNRTSAASTAAPAAVQPTASQDNAEASALQMLASIVTNNEVNMDTTAANSATQVPNFAPADASSDLPHVGTWNVNLPGNQSVALVLNSDGSFAWTATKDGKSSSFEGQYRLEDQRLILVRSSDLQQMAGSWTISGQGFTFKLDGATTGGLEFSRS